MSLLPREIRTDRLLLRAVNVDDAPAQVEAVADSLAELGRWMPWARRPQSLETAEENLGASARDFGEGSFEYAMWRDGVCAGRIGVHGFDARVPKGEIGYWTRTTFAGQGLMKEAVRALTDTMLEAGFRRVEIRCDARNEASAAVARACGFHRDALLVNNDVSAQDPTQLRDTLVFSVTR